MNGPVKTCGRGALEKQNYSSKTKERVWLITCLSTFAGARIDSASENLVLLRRKGKSLDKITCRPWSSTSTAWKTFRAADGSGRISMSNVIGPLHEWRKLETSRSRTRSPFIPRRDLWCPILLPTNADILWKLWKFNMSSERVSSRSAPSTSHTQFECVCICLWSGVYAVRYMRALPYILCDNFPSLMTCSQDDSATKQIIINVRQEVHSPRSQVDANAKCIVF